MDSHKTSTTEPLCFDLSLATNICPMTESDLPMVMTTGSESLGIPGWVAKLILGRVGSKSVEVQRTMLSLSKKVANKPFIQQFFTLSPGTYEASTCRNGREYRVYFRIESQYNILVLEEHQVVCVVDWSKLPKVLWSLGEEQGRDVVKEMERAQKSLSDIKMNEAVAVDDTFERFGLAPLEGSRKQVEWALGIRAKYVVFLEKEHQLNRIRQLEEYIRAVNEERSAWWWIQYRDELHAQITDSVTDNQGAPFPLAKMHGLSVISDSSPEDNLVANQIREAFLKFITSPDGTEQLRALDAAMLQNLLKQHLSALWWMEHQHRLIETFLDALKPRRSVVRGRRTLMVA